MQHKPKQDTNEVRLAVLETSVSHMYQALERIEKNIEKGFDGLNKKIDAVEDRLNKKIDAVEDKLNKKIDAVEDRLNHRMNKVEDLALKNLYFTLGLMSSFIIGIILTIARSFHWFGG